MIMVCELKRQNPRQTFFDPNLLIHLYCDVSKADDINVGGKTQFDQILFWLSPIIDDPFLQTSICKCINI